MQKAKKMSKQTLVIAVLAVLLVLSLALTVTGAWFTDSANGKGTTDVTFATVAVAATDAAANWTTTGRTETNKILPGDKVAFEGTIDNIGSNVDILVGIVLTNIKVVAKSGSTEYDITTQCAKTGTGVSTLNTVTGMDALTTTFTAGTATGKIYKVEKGDKTANYTGTFEFEGANLKNYVPSGSTNIVLNKGANDIPAGAITDATFTISMTIEVYAIQYDNLSDGNDEAHAAIAATQFTALYDAAHPAQPAA